jgi:hypothetical protein
LLGLELFVGLTFPVATLFLDFFLDNT